jgi:hypothetical protein
MRYMLLSLQDPDLRCNQDSLGWVPNLGWVSSPDSVVPFLKTRPDFIEDLLYCTVLFVLLLLIFSSEHMQAHDRHHKE